MAAHASPDGIRPAGLGPLIRMRQLNIQQLPAHPDLASQQSAPADIQLFVQSALEEAVAFMEGYLPHHFQARDGVKSSPPSAVGVTVLQGDIKGSELPIEVRQPGTSNEAWFARLSVHDNAAKEGTASWEEFEQGLRIDHSKHEKDYTPGVVDAHEVMNWDSELVEPQRKIGDWEDVRVCLMEMQHHIPAPLNNRVFPVLVISGKRNNENLVMKDKEFLVVQIPVSTKGLPNAKYHDVSKVTEGMYVSIEKCELVEEGSKVQWQMATASDARGSLPMWAQRMGVPGAIVKDVGLFIDWCAKNRRGRSTGNGR